MRLVPRGVTARINVWARSIANDSSEQVSARVERSVQDEMRDLARMLRQQGDAADELAEVFGRTLLRLSETVDELRARLDRLDRLDTAEGHASRIS
jgi:hypothetical protein